MQKICPQCNQKIEIRFKTAIKNLYICTNCNKIFKGTLKTNYILIIYFVQFLLFAFIFKTIPALRTGWLLILTLSLFAVISSILYMKICNLKFTKDIIE